MRSALLPAALFPALLASAPFSAAQWEILPAPTTADLRGIHSLGNGIAWASGTGGTVLRTTDDGKHWQLCATPPDAEHLDFRGIQAFDASTAIVMSSGKGDLSRLYKTTNACRTWTLVFTNPDPEGFWDALQFDPREPMNPAPDWRSHMRGVLLGDQVSGAFVIYMTPDSGQTWFNWSAPQNNKSYAKTKPAKARSDESIFAASNSAIVRPGFEFRFVTGGKGGSRLFSEEEHSPFDAFYWLSFSTKKLPFESAQSAGAFSIATNGKDFVIVGGDYKKPDDTT